MPPAAASQLWLDFDGTITQRDVLDDLIQRFAANDSWKLIEQRWQAGLIGSRQCLSEEFALLRVGSDELAEFLCTVAVDPGLTRLLDLLRRQRVPVAIVSDGIDRFIRPVLRRHGHIRLRVRANTASHRGERLSLRCPHASSACECAAAHCKCASIEALSRGKRASIYVGDGRSDLCPARKADVVFAKGALAQALHREGRHFIPFVTLHDVVDRLENAWATEVLGDGDAISDVREPRSA